MLAHGWSVAALGRNAWSEPKQKAEILKAEIVSIFHFPNFDYTLLTSDFIFTRFLSNYFLYFLFRLPASPCICRWLFACVFILSSRPVPRVRKTRAKFPCAPAQFRSAVTGAGRKTDS